MTVEGTTYPLPKPYLVIATENPIEQHGTYPLPEGQLDRFALTGHEKDLVRARDFGGLLAGGANIYFLLKLGVVTGNGLYKMGAAMRGETYEQFLATRNDSGAT